MSGDVHVRIWERSVVRFPEATQRNIHLGSRRAGGRVMASVPRFTTKTLRLREHESKSAAATPWERGFLGLRFTADRQPKRRISPQAVLRFRVLAQRTRDKSQERMVEDLGRLADYGQSVGS